MFQELDLGNSISGILPADELYTDTTGGVYIINTTGNSQDVTQLLNTQLILQQELYTFFGTAEFADIQKYLLFIPQGSIFFHGDNINEGEMLYSKLDIVEKVILNDADGEEYYQYKINETNVSYDSPIIKIVTKIDGVEVINSVTQASALLSKASHLRLVSNIKNANEKMLEEIATAKWSKDENKNIYTAKSEDNQLWLQIYQYIDAIVQLIYDNSVNGLLEKSKTYDIFEPDWKNKQTNTKKYKKGKGTVLLTKKILQTKETELETYINSIPDKHQKNKVNTYYANSKSISQLLSKPEDEIIKPPAKTQFFGNPCAETNIVLMKGSSSPDSKTDSKYLYTMQVYMFQKDICLLDYTKLRFIFDDEKFASTFKGRYTGINKRSMHWASYFKSDENASKKAIGTYTLPFQIRLDLPKLNVTQKQSINDMNEDGDSVTKSYIDNNHKKLDESYEKLNDFEERRYILRNNQPKDDSPIVAHLNYILNLRGMNVNIQGFTDFDPAETYTPPTSINKHISSVVTNPEVMGMYGQGVICREYTVFNSPKNLLYLCYASTLPNYKSFNPSVNESFFDQDGRLIKSGNELVTANNKCADTNNTGNEEMFVDFTNINLFDPNNKYKKNSINIYDNKFAYGKEPLKIIKPKYQRKGVVGSETKYPQMKDIQEFLNDYKVRENIYDTIFYKLANIRYLDMYLTMVDSRGLVLDDSHKRFKNVFQGLSLVFTSGSESFFTITPFRMTKFINNVNSGMVKSYYDQSFSPFSGVDLSFVDEELEISLTPQHDTYNFAANHLSGAVYNLIKYNLTCPHDWKETASTLTEVERSTCAKIEDTINRTDNNVIKTITDSIHTENDNITKLLTLNVEGEIDSSALEPDTDTKEAKVKSKGVEVKSKGVEDDDFRDI